MDVSEELEDIDPPRIRTYWVFKQKVTDEEMNFKASLVCKDYEEETPSRGDTTYISCCFGLQHS